MNGQKGNVLLILISGVAIIVIAVAGYFYYVSHLQDKEPHLQAPLPDLTITPTIVAQADETANWKTYQNDKYGFTLKYPPTLAVDLQNVGFISGSDYFGKRDFNLLINDPKIEPSHEGPISDGTGKQTWQYDGYNFAIFSGDSAMKQWAIKADIIKSGDKYSPPLQKTATTVLGKDYPLYYLPPSNLPNHDKTSFWFVSFPLGQSTVIVSGNYDRRVLIQILSTFKFVNQ